MTISGIGSVLSTSPVFPASSSDATSATDPSDSQSLRRTQRTQFRSDFASLLDAVKAGDMSSAQQALTAVQTDRAAIGATYSSSSGQGQDKGAIPSDMQSLFDAVQQGDASAAQQALTKLQTDAQQQAMTRGAQGHGHHHHHRRHLATQTTRARRRHSRRASPLTGAPPRRRSSRAFVGRTATGTQNSPRPAGSWAVLPRETDLTTERFECTANTAPCGSLMMRSALHSGRPLAGASPCRRRSPRAPWPRQRCRPRRSAANATACCMSSGFFIMPPYVKAPRPKMW